MEGSGERSHKFKERSIDVNIYRGLKLELRRAGKSEGLQEPSGQKTSWHLGYTYVNK